MARSSMGESRSWLWAPCVKVTSFLQLLFTLDFNKAKQKIEQKRLDGVQLEIRRVEVCQTIHVSGLSQNTTTDALQLHFENTRRSGGDAVQEMDYNSGEDQAVVHFASPKGTLWLFLFIIITASGSEYYS